MLNVLSDEEKKAEAQSGKFLVTFALVDSLLKNTKETILVVSYSTKVVGAVYKYLQDSFLFYLLNLLVIVFLDVGSV